jgi:hypothetical protein
MSMTTELFPATIGHRQRRRFTAVAYVVGSRWQPVTEQHFNQPASPLEKPERKTVGVARGDARTNRRHTHSAILFSCPVGDDERHDVRCGHSD